MLVDNIAMCWLGKADAGWVGTEEDPSTTPVLGGYPAERGRLGMTPGSVLVFEPSKPRSFLLK
jgi:hypothetical protein